MKSKELIQEYIHECDRFGWAEYEGKYWKPELQIILKDLEVLEILKDNAVITKGEGRWKGIEVIDICIGSESTDGYNLIKEWLEDKDERD